MTSDWFRSTIRESGRATADLHAEPSEPQIFTTWATTESSRQDKPSMPEIGLPRYFFLKYHFTGCCLSINFTSSETLLDTFLYKLPSLTEKLHDSGAKSTPIFSFFCCRSINHFDSSRKMQTPLFSRRCFEEVGKREQLGKFEKKFANSARFSSISANFLKEQTIFTNSSKESISSHHFSSFFITSRQLSAKFRQFLVIFINFGQLRAISNNFGQFRPIR